ncbi:MAG: nitrate reductase associated protein [Cyanobacterium sp. T60_A2020_053]|nr:nitrate reductase associated protein [Cyanobacterium sp. T60_A2020_053]
MNYFFEFESDFVESLRCIPMIVRMKLDTCGVKLKLFHWHQFSQLERETVVKMPCEIETDINNYRRFVQDLVIAKTGEPAPSLPVEKEPAWHNKQTIPESVQEKAQEFDVKISIEKWQKLTPLQRFALIKLSHPSHENRNFLPALKEFNLL